MAGWFDKYAKKSATSVQSDPVESGSLSRRRVIVGGSAAVATTAAAWTAPALMASAAATVGLSVCPATRVKVCTDGSQKCCPNSTDTCNIVGGVQVCSAENAAGGSCGNCGNGTCPAGFKCSGQDQQNNNAEATNICGGEGAQCCPRRAGVAGCFGDNLTCVAVGTSTSEGFCRKRCTTAASCRTDGVTAGSPRCPGAVGPQTCSTDGFCGAACQVDGDCGGSGTCAAGVCSYQRDANLTRTCANAA